jgi:hypothetical protein
VGGHIDRIKSWDGHTKLGAWDGYANKGAIPNDVLRLIGFLNGREVGICSSKLKMRAESPLLSMEPSSLSWWVLHPSWASIIL